MCCCLCTANTDEPPLQHRKRTTLSSLALEASKYQDDDYFLVGDQAKFAPSIPYRSRSLDRKAWILAKVTTNNYFLIYSLLRSNIVKFVFKNFFICSS